MFLELFALQIFQSRVYCTLFKPKNFIKNVAVLVPIWHMSICKRNIDLFRNVQTKINRLNSNSSISLEFEPKTYFCCVKLLPPPQYLLVNNFLIKDVQTKNWSVSEYANEHLSTNVTFNNNNRDLNLSVEVDRPWNFNY